MSAVTAEHRGPGEFVDLADAQDLYFERGWTDGLPIVPPTEERVDAMLSTVDSLDFDTTLGHISERRRVLTAGKAAVNAVMAGCRPEYFPVVVTALRAALQPQFNLHTVSSSTGGAAPLIVVSGPLVDEIGMNAKGNAFGPGNRANATIGRAMRLVLINVFGAVAGGLDGSTLGHPGKYTFCIAEDDPPPQWPTLREELGYSPEWSAVLVFPGEGPRQVANETSDDVRAILRTFAAAISVPSNYIAGHTSDVGGSVMAVIGPEHADSIRRAGWSKQDVREFLFEHTWVTRDQLVAAGRITENDDSVGDRFRTVSSPQDLTIVTAGGYGGRWSAVIPSWARTVTSRAVSLPVESTIDDDDLDCGIDGCNWDGAGEIPQVETSSSDQHDHHDHDH